MIFLWFVNSIPGLQPICSTVCSHLAVSVYRIVALAAGRSHDPTIVAPAALPAGLSRSRLARENEQYSKEISSNTEFDKP